MKMMIMEAVAVAVGHLVSADSLPYSLVGQPISQYYGHSFTAVSIGYTLSIGYLYIGSK